MIKTIMTGFLLLFSCRGSSQQTHLHLHKGNGDFFNTLEKEQLRYLDSLFVAEAGYDNNFVNGRDYVPYYYRSESNPILHAGKEGTAGLVYEGRAFDNLFLQYDTYLDRIIYCITDAETNTTLRRVALNPFNISSCFLCFEHDTLNFRYLSREQDNDFNLDDGFYEIVYEGRYPYIVKHQSVKYKLHGRDEYTYKPSGYIKADDGFVMITSRKKFVSLFDDKSDEISRFITEKRIKIRKADKQKILAVLQYYERICTGCK